MGFRRRGTILKPAISVLGEIFNDDFARGAIGSDYTNTSGAFSCNGSELVASFVGGGIWSNSLLYTKNSYTSNLERFTQVLTYNVGLLTNGAFGIAFGVKSTVYDFQSILFLSPDVLFGQIRFYTDTGNTVLQTSGTAMTLQDYDDLTATLTRDKNVFTVTYENHRSGEILTMSYTFSLVYPIAPLFTPRVYNPAIWTTGGTQTVTNWVFSSSALVGAKFIFIGDSITSGYFANTTTNRWAELAAGTSAFNVYAGPGNFANEFNSAEIINLSPVKAVVCLGTNDKLSFVPDATIITRITTLKNALQAAGITVIVCMVPPNDSISMASLNADILSNFGAGPDFYTLLKGGGSAYAVGKSPDGIHPANTEQQNMANEVLLYV